MYRSAFRRFISRLSMANIQRSRKRNGLVSVSDAAEILEVRVVPARETIPLGSIDVTTGVNFFTTEDHGTTTFTVQLSNALIAKNSRRAATVTIPVSSSNPQEGTVSTQSLVFSTTSGQSAKIVTLTGVDDDLIDGDKAYSIILGKIKVTNVKNYSNKIDPRDLSLVNKDNDQLDPGLIFSQTELTVNDASSGEVSVRLSSRPTSNVQVSLAVTEGVSQGTISTSQLTFTPANWNVAQKFFIGMYLEGLHDGDKPFEVSVDTTSSDPEYDELPTEFVSVVNHDIDPLEFSIPGKYLGSYHTITFTQGLPNLPPFDGEIQLTLQDGLVTVVAPGGGTGTYTGDQVSFTVNGGATFEGPMTFSGQITENNDNTVTISGIWVFAPVSSPEATGTWTSTGPIPDVPGFQVSPSSNLSILEGDQEELTFVLNTQPTSDVEISMVFSEGTGEAQLSTSSLIFTPENWNIPQTLTITGVEDQVADGNQDFVFIARVFTSDPNYFSVPSKSLTVAIIDSGVVIRNLEGDYQGTFEGTVSFLGDETPVTGPVAFNISGDQVTVTQPAPAVGALDGGTSSFSPQSGPFSGAVFSGTYVTNGDGSITASGSWSIDTGAIVGSGTWTATRPPLAL